MTDTEKQKLRQIVNVVHKHIPFFQKYWEKFCRMVEGYGEYVEKCRNDPRCKCDRDIAEQKRRANAEEQLLGEMSVLADQLNDARLRGDGKAVKRLKGRLQKRNVEIENLSLHEEPPEPGSVLCQYWNFRYLSDAIAMGPVWLPPGPVNPILWFGLFGYKDEPALRAPSSEEERLVFNCARLSVVHDIGGDLSPGGERIFYRKDRPYTGKYFERDKFCFDLWGKLRTPDGLAEVERALDSVLPAIEKKAKKPAETGGDTKRTIAAVVISLLVDCIFELSVWFVAFTPFSWLKKHPNSYGLQPAIVLLVPCIFVGLLKRQYRKWCLRTAVALVVLILSLLSGRSGS